MSEQKLDDILIVLKDLLKWSKFQGLPQFKKLVSDTLKTDEDKILYELSDGINSTRDIERIAKISKSTVGYQWKKWLKIGIVTESTKFEGRMKHLASLEEIGIELPPFLKSRESTSTEKPGDETHE